MSPDGQFYIAPHKEFISAGPVARTRLDRKARPPMMGARTRRFATTGTEVPRRSQQAALIKKKWLCPGSWALYLGSCQNWLFLSQPQKPCRTRARSPRKLASSRTPFLGGRQPKKQSKGPYFENRISRLKLHQHKCCMVMAPNHYDALKEPYDQSSTLKLSELIRVRWRAAWPVNQTL